MLGLVVGGFWLIFVAYSIWFYFKAETLQPLTLDDLALAWKLHKRETGCTASHIHSLITKSNEVVGFKCDCGYKLLQKRLITQKTYPRTGVSYLPSSEGASPPPITKDSLQNLGIPYSHIKEI